jgi:hypothetical protein
LFEDFCSSFVRIIGTLEPFLDVYCWLDVAGFGRLTAKLRTEAVRHEESLTFLLVGGIWLHHSINKILTKTNKIIIYFQSILGLGGGTLGICKRVLEVEEGHW